MTVPLNIRTTERKKRAISLDLARGAMLLLIALAHAPLSNGIAALIAVGIWSLSVLLAAILEKNNLSGPLEILLRRLVDKNK